MDSLMIGHCVIKYMVLFVAFCLKQYNINKMQDEHIGKHCQRCNRKDYIPYNCKKCKAIVSSFSKVALR